MLTLFILSPAIGLSPTAFGENCGRRPSGAPRAYEGGFYKIYALAAADG